MQACENTELEAMTINELRRLKDDIDDAIRAAIRRQRLQRDPMQVAQTPPPAATIDLERERDAWMNARGRETRR